MQTKQCAWLLCGKPFEPGRSANRRASYCSPGCRLQAHRARGRIVSSSTAPERIVSSGTATTEDRFSAPVKPVPISLPVLSPDELPVVQSRWQPCVAPLPPGVEPDDLLIPKELLR
jgi:hypothetical protein